MYLLIQGKIFSRNNKCSFYLSLVNVGSHTRSSPITRKENAISMSDHDLLFSQSYWGIIEKYNFMHLKWIMWWFGMCICCEMLTTAIHHVTWFPFFYNAVLLTIVTTQYIIFPPFYHLILEFNTFCFDSTDSWDHMVFIFLYLVYLYWCSPGSSMSSQMGEFPSLIWLNDILLFTTLHILILHIKYTYYMYAYVYILYTYMHNIYYQISLAQAVKNLSAI